MAELKSGDVVLSEVPQAEYMYGCAATSVGMLLAYYEYHNVKGYDFSNLFEGEVELNARGLDGNAYDMDAFDTVLGSGIATEQYVKYYYGKTEEEELPYVFIGDTLELNFQYYDCIAAYLGTGMAGRGGDDLSTIYFHNDNKALTLDDVKAFDDKNKVRELQYGLDLYVQSRNYQLDGQGTKTVMVENFSFEDYMAEIDAGRPVLLHVTGHAMLGYGYNKETKEIIFDDTYLHDQRMSWDGTYAYAGENRTLKGVTLVDFDFQGMDLIAPVFTVSTEAITEDDVYITVTYSESATVKQYSFDETLWLNYTEPVCITENCTVYFKGSNPDTDSESPVVCYEVKNIDKKQQKAPTVSADITTATNKNVTVTALFSEYSVVQEYSLDGETWLAYTGPIEVTDNATLYFRGTNEKSEYTKVVSYEVTNIDKVAPDAPTAAADITALTNTDVTVTAAFSKDTAAREYSSDGKTWQKYSEPIAVSANTTLYFRGTDAAGNVSGVTVYEVTNIDRTPPADPVVTANTVAVTNMDVTVTANYSQDSVRKEYSYDGETWLEYPGKVMAAVNTTLYFRGVDAAGNASGIVEFVVDNIDRTPPVQPTVTASRGRSRVSQEAVVLTADFSLDSVTREYSYDQKTWLPYWDGVTVRENMTLYFRGTDAAGNVSEVTPIEVSNIDCTPPDQPVAAADVTKPTQGRVTVTASFSEDSVRKQYSLDGTFWQKYTGGITVSENTVLYFRAADEADNMSEAVSFAVTNIDRTPPTQPTASADITSPTNSEVTVTAVFADDTVKKEYSRDGETWLTYVDGVTVQENTILYFRGADAAGNQTEVTSYEVANIDRTPPTQPTASADVTSPTNSEVTVTAVFSDDTVKKEYSRDGETWLTYLNGVAVQENTVLYFRGADAAGNQTEVTSYEVANIDKTPPTQPTASADITSPTNSEVTVTAVFSDDTAKKEYSPDGVTWLTYVDGVTVQENTVLYFRGADALGNTSESYCFSVTNIDRTPPAQPAVVASTTAKTNEDVALVAFFSADSVRQEYSSDGRIWQKYTEKIVVPDNSTFYFRSFDAVGNVSATTAYQVANIVSDNWQDRKNAGSNGSVFDAGSCTLAFESQNRVGKDDAADYLAIKLESAANLSFDIDSENAVKFTISELTGTPGKYKLKTRQSTTVKADRSLQTKKILLEAGTYYLGIVNTKASAADASYTLRVSDNSVFFTQGDHSDDWSDLKTRGAAALPADLGTLTKDSTAAWEGWVGFGDSVDYTAFALETSAKVSFAVESTDAVKFCIYELTEKSGKYSLKKLQSTAVSADSSATTKGLLLKQGTYFLGMESVNAKKGGNASYSVTVSGQSEFYPAADNGNDSWQQAQVQTALETGETASGWVGFGDPEDFRKIDVAEDGRLTLTLDEETAAAIRRKELKLSCVNETGKKVTLQQSSEDIFASAKNLAAGEYYLGISCTNEKKYQTSYSITTGLLTVV